MKIKKKICYSSIIHQLFINYSSIIHQLFINYSSIIHQLFINYSSIIHQLFIIFYHKKNFFCLYLNYFLYFFVFCYYILFLCFVYFILERIRCCVDIHMSIGKSLASFPVRLPRLGARCPSRIDHRSL